jgi:hypothetical protein
MVEAKLEKGVFVCVGDEINVSAIAAIATAGTTARNKLLAAKGNTAVPAVACFDCDFRFVDEHEKKGR